MPAIIGISGSLRRDSFNTSLLSAAQDLVPEGTDLEIASISGIPLYNFDIEAETGIPQPVDEIKELLSKCHGLLICSPEYNNSVPGVLKNAIDWLSRPSDDIPRVFGGLPVALTGASPGRFGTMLAQNAWLPIFRTLGMLHWSGGRLLVPGASQIFDDQGNLVDDALRERLRDFMRGFAEFIESRPDRHQSVQAGN